MGAAKRKGEFIAGCFADWYDNPDRVTLERFLADMQRWCASNKLATPSTPAIALCYNAIQRAIRHAVIPV